MLAILTPSRGRPERAAEMVEAVKWAGHEGATVWFGLDEDDPTVDRYFDLFKNDISTRMSFGPRKNLVEWTNYLAKEAALAGYEYLASLGDDHLPRTLGWDTKLIGAIRAMGGHGFAHGNDLLRPSLPTAWVQSTSVYEALGWMMLPTCEHLMVDIVVRDLGQASGRLAVLPSVIVEHMHPAGGKAHLDDLYAASNSSAQVERDRLAYEAWVRDGLARDAETIRALS